MGFLSACSLRLDPMQPLCWHLDGEHVPRQALRVCVDGAAAARRQRCIQSIALRLANVVLPARVRDCRDRELSANVGGILGFAGLRDLCPEWRWRLAPAARASSVRRRKAKVVFNMKNCSMFQFYFRFQFSLRCQGAMHDLRLPCSPAVSLALAQHQRQRAAWRIIRIAPSRIETCRAAP